MKPTYVHREKPDAYLFLGVVMRVLLTSEDTGGQFTMIEGTMPPKGDGGLHVHRDDDESMTLLEGALDVTVGEVGFRLEAGQSYFAPARRAAQVAKYGYGSRPRSPRDDGWLRFLCRTSGHSGSQRSGADIAATFA